MKKVIHIIGGGTISEVRPHLALCAPAFGTVAKQLEELCQLYKENFDIKLHLTKMADNKSNIKTNEDLIKLLQELIGDPATKIIFMSAAVCDFDGNITSKAGIKDIPSGRLESKFHYLLALSPSNKIISQIRKDRKDIFLVGFKTTAGDNKQEQYLKGLDLCKSASCNLVLANDIETKINMIITPEEAAYNIGERQEALINLVDMAVKRSQLTFTRSTVVDGELIPWKSDLIPMALKEVVDHCIRRGAYQTFNGSTVGHFAAKIDENTFLTSIRKSNFNEMPRQLVKVMANGDEKVIAHGAKPSVGGQSQRIIFKEHVGYDCIVHFHCPLKNTSSTIPIRSQRDIECGSHECGKNTSDGLKHYSPLYDGPVPFAAVMLDNHGPNIVFNSKANPKHIIEFIENNFDLTKKTGGFNLSNPSAVNESPTVHLADLPPPRGTHYPPT